MRLRDYLRLGLANIACNRRRCVLVVIITGAMFALIFAGFEVIRGLEVATQKQVTDFTDGQVLLKLTVEDGLEDSEDELARQVVKYGGYTEPVEEYWFDEMIHLYLFPARLKESLADKIIDDVAGGVPILISTDEAGRWRRLTISKDMGMQRRLELVAKIRAQSLGKVIENNGFGTRPDIERTQFFVAGLLPANLVGVSLSLSNIGDMQNPLNFILEVIPTGSSETFVLERPEGVEVSTKEREIWAVFPDAEIAYEFVMDRQMCSGMNKTCISKYRYMVREVIGNPLGVKMGFREIEKVYTIIWIVLTAIGAFITISTYTRLINQEVRNIALYRALGATVKNVYIIYATYLVILSLLTMVVALAVGTLLALVVSLVYQGALSADFSISFGVEPVSVWLAGWDSTVLVIVAINVVVALASTGVNIFQLSMTKVAQKLKG